MLNASLLSPSAQFSKPAHWTSAIVPEEVAEKQKSNPFIGPDYEVNVSQIKNVKMQFAADAMRSRVKEFASYHELDIFVASWNVNNKAAPNLDAWLHGPVKKRLQGATPDVFILGFQELDTSNQAYYSSTGIREDEWTKAAEASINQLDAPYVKFASKQLVGMLIMGFVKKSLQPEVSEISVDAVGCGILGMIGNKGGVAIRFRLIDSYFCFVNSHLAADTGMVERRNQDFGDVCRRMAFSGLKESQYGDYTAWQRAHPWVCHTPDVSRFVRSGTGSKAFDQVTFSMADSPQVVSNKWSIWDCDHLVWLGDLNYRLTVPDSEIRLALSEGRYGDLLKKDQLNVEKTARHAFVNFWEADISFPPTYKYDVGTNNFDSSEKRRAPAWCDRILSMTNPIHRAAPDIDDQPASGWNEVLWYDSVPEATVSDHKPVIALHRFAVRSVDQAKLQVVQDDITRMLDIYENEATPDVHIEETQLEFGAVRFLESYTKLMMVENKGCVNAHFKVVAKPGEVDICPSWCHIYPTQSKLGPAQAMTVAVTIHVGRTGNSAAKLNIGEQSLADILIFHVEHGKDVFVSISGSWSPTVFGCPFGLLCQLPKPMARFSRAELQKTYEDYVRSVSHSTASQNALENTHQGAMGDGFAASIAEGLARSGSSKPGFSIPREIWRLVDFLYRYGMDVPYIFQRGGVPETMDYVRHCLNSGEDFDLACLLLDDDSGNRNSEPDSRPSEQATGAHDANAADAYQPPKIPRRHGRASSVHSFVDVLLTLLASSMEPVVPYRYFERIVNEGYLNFSAAKSVLVTLPPVHYNIFVYLCSFCKEILSMYSGTPQLTVDTLVSVLAPILLAQSPKTRGWISLTPNPALASQQLHGRRSEGSTQARSDFISLDRPSDMATIRLASSMAAAAALLSSPRSASSYVDKLNVLLPLWGPLGGTMEGMLCYQIPRYRPPVPLLSLFGAATMVKIEFAFFPWHWLRVSPPFLRRSLPDDFHNPWRRLDEWRFHPFFDLRNRMRAALPGFGIAVGAFTVYKGYELADARWGNTARENAEWAAWLEERNKRLHQDAHH
ncbi:hypothetical protein CXG81DRAFT_14185 [Caulochytrium protostelioides]|uniref:DNase I-like protein n=1 Tax=Caulochytrium protostelioides TaxID=1555241 RepID=A0A4P9X1L2_9FUNG|nr:DNase I-like protein [Caulochytrium protostelioides]RKO99686.1 hypothetical protein CXG81DRAFT_14185 [Caulochytrium protostelioides]|eukprot:RKO99686.1 hypothetical protein CXG81DRAFT_14185 [Caulochytrium protostelioides]